MLNRFLALMFLMMLIAGCQSMPPLHPTDQLADPAALNGEATAISPAELLPLKPNHGFYRLHPSDEQDQDLPFHWTPDPDHQELWRQEIQQHTITWMKRLADGSMAIVREDDLQEEVSIEYEPALVVLPANLSTASHQGQTQMTVRDLDDRRLKAAGECQYQVHWLGRQKLQTYGGIIDCHLIRVHRMIRLPIARVNVDVITAYQTGHGQIAERVVQTTQALGFFGSQETSELRLVRWIRP